MGIRAPLVMSLLLVAGMFAVSFWAWPMIPDTARVAVHWSIDGTPDNFMRPGIALLLTPCLAAVSTLLFAAVPFRSKRAAQLARASSGYVAGWLGAMVLMFVAHVLMVLHARGLPINVSANMTFAGGLLFIVMGNFLGKTRPNPFVGVRTPWTKMSDYSWEKTHRAAGKMVVAVGLATLASFAVADAHMAHRVFIFGIFAMAAASIALSYYYWRCDPHRAR